MGNMVKVVVRIRGTRPLLQHCFGPDSIPLEDQERTGKAGNDPEEWKRTKLVNDDGELYVLDSYVFGMLKDAAKHTKKGRGSFQSFVAATLQVLETVILIGRRLPEDGPKHNAYGQPVYIDVRGTRNQTTKGRNVRYRLAAAPGWECKFTISWDKTVVPRDVMKAILIDASILAGLGDGRTIGMGRFEVLEWKELTDAEEAPAAGSVADPPADRVEKGRKKVRAVPEAAGDNGVSR